MGALFGGGTPQSPAATAPASRGALGMAQSLMVLPRPPLLGAVALRSNDGGVLSLPPENFFQKISKKVKGICVSCIIESETAKIQHKTA